MPVSLMSRLLEGGLSKPYCVGGVSGRGVSERDVGERDVGERDVGERDVGEKNL
jgi:hypothetical protein